MTSHSIVVSKLLPASSTIKDIPELRLSPSNTVDPNILRIPKGQADWPSSLIPLIAILIIPLLPITKEQRLSMSLQRKVFAANPPSRTPGSVCHTDTILEPILDIIVPGKLAADGDVAVLQSHVHDFGNGKLAFSCTSRSQSQSLHLHRLPSCQ